MALAAVVLLIIIAFIFVFRQTAEASTMDYVCLESVAEASDLPSTERNKILIKCPTKETTIKSNDEEEIKLRLAEEMANCWGKMGKLEKNPFKNWDSEVVCYVCTKINFKTDKKVENLALFLTKNIKDKTTGGTFYHSFTGLPATKQTESVLTTLNVEIDTSLEYSTIFILSNTDLEGFWKKMGTNPTEKTLQENLMVLIPGVTIGSANMQGQGIGFGSGIFSNIAGVYNEAVMLVPYSYAKENKCMELED